MKKQAFWLAAAMLAARLASAEDQPRGRIVDDVVCEADAKQHYSLYLPSNFSADREWPVILGFDAGGRGRRAVERYQEAAERYGFIVAGSNNSKNGPWEVSLTAAEAMSADVLKHFPINHARIYTAGMSGGARVAMLLALESQSGAGKITGRDRVAGVFASSAGFPDNFHESVGFPIFGSAGTNDFNHQEMIELNRGVKTPHRLEVFDGTHEWLPVALATDGVEWMEIQAIRSKLRTRDDKLVDEIFAKRMARAEAATGSLEKMRELWSIVLDFDGLKDVAALQKRAASLERQFDVKKALEAERTEEDLEIETGNELYRLRNAMDTGDNFARLKARVLALVAQSKADQDSSTRRIARRVLTGFNASSRGTGGKPFQDLLDQIRPPGPPGQ